VHASQCGLAAAQFFYVGTILNRDLTVTGNKERKKEEGKRKRKRKREKEEEKGREEGEGREKVKRGRRRKSSYDFEKIYVGIDKLPEVGSFSMLG